MGQCSTLPAEGRPASGRRDPPDNNDSMNDQRHRLSDRGRKESLDFNAIVNPVEATAREHAKKLAEKRGSLSNAAYEDPPQTRDPHGNMSPSPIPEPMEVDSRDEAPPVPIPPPPEGSVRTRCYKLNLDSELNELPPVQRSQYGLGPFTEPPPYLTYSSSEDSSQGTNPTQVAIQTAQIFRGITVSRDGTILSQNARATRSNRGNKTKRGEKSRQASKIDKAKDLVEEAIANGAKATESGEEPTMVSLVIVGEYDDMKYLVRDGSKKLRESDGQPDESLRAMNRPRYSLKTKHESSSTATAVLSPRKRSSASQANVDGHRGAPGQVQDRLDPTLPQSAPPKLKSHPRDNRPTRREDRNSLKMRLDSCHDFMTPRRGEHPGDGDWSHAWNIWNCGGTGTVSPQYQPSSPTDAPKAAFEGRDSHPGMVRESGVTGRMD